MSKVSRRQFLKVGGAAAAALAGSGTVARAMETEKGESSYNYARVARRREAAYTVSPYGKLKSPLEVYIEDGERVVAVAGHAGHPASRGRTTALDAVSHLVATDPDRLVYPLKRDSARGGDKWRRISWEEALKEISEGVKRSVRERGAGSVCLVRGEDTQDGLLGRFMHTLGSPSTVEMSGGRNKKAGQSMTWGADIETPDFANSDYILNFGSNIYETFPAFAQALVDGRADNHAKLVTLDPRMSMTAGLSDEWVPVKPGTDGLVALAMANVIMEKGLADTDFINRWTNVTAAQLAEHLSQFTVDMAEEHSGIPADTISRIALEFAKAGSATIFTYRGVSSHSNGVSSERACMLLPVITGNVEVRGGYCLPRRIKWDEVRPVPAEPVSAKGLAGQTFPYEVKSGKAPVGILFNCGTNPAHSAPASAYWREVLKDERLVPLSVSITSHMTETASLCDIVLPDAVYLEKSGPVSSPSSLFPWLGASTPLVEAPGEVRPLATILRDIIHAVDTEGDMGYRKYWEFEDYEEWMGLYFEKVPGLGEEGGYDTLVENGVWPSYGELDTATGKFLNEDGEPLQAEYGIHKKSGFSTSTKKIEIYSSGMEMKGFGPLPGWAAPENLAAEDEGLTFVTYKTAYQCGPGSANNKYLAEKSHANHCMINKKTAHELGIKDGALIRIIGPAGYMVTKAMATNAIHPEVVAVAASFGHKAIGRVAGARPQHKAEWAGGEDPDVANNLWWRDTGVNPNDIIPLFVDPVGGGSSFSFMVKVEPASRGDEYGTVRVDIARHETYFKKASEQIKA